ncbi:6639_t:CDS:2, partial [Acaulospora morrowiae]
KCELSSDLFETLKEDVYSVLQKFGDRQNINSHENAKKRARKLLSSFDKTCSSTGVRRFIDGLKLRDEEIEFRTTLFRKITSSNTLQALEEHRVVRTLIEDIRNPDELEHQVLPAGNSGTQSINSYQRKHHRDETTDDDEPEKQCRIRKTSTDESKRIIRQESSTSSGQNDIEVDEIDMLLSENPIIQRLIEAGGIGRYKIVFLPEENDCDAIKSIFNKNEWSKLEIDWINAEKKTIPSSNVMNENISTLLKKYSDGINEATFGYDVDLRKLSVLFDETSIASRDTYIFTREWPTQWIKSIFNAFLLCFQLPINPLHDCNLSEYSYRDRIVNRIIEDIFLDTYSFIRVRTGEVENTDRKDQKNSARPQGQR